MASLGAALAFPLGGVGFTPFIVNLSPGQDDSEVSIADAVRFSIRNVESYIDAGQLQVALGYAHVRASGTQLYEEEIAEAFLSSSNYGDVAEEPKATIIVGTPYQGGVGGIEFTKTQNNPQRSVYYVGTNIYQGDLNAAVTAVVRPDYISSNAQGAVLGIEHSFRNTAAYLYFTNPSGITSLRLVGPENSEGVRTPDTEIAFDWSSYARRYIVLWNEVRHVVEVYVVDSTNTQLLMSEDISSFGQFDYVNVGTPTPRRGGEGDVTLLFGIEGPSWDTVTFENVALSADVGYPLIGGSRPGEFRTIRQTDELVRYPGYVDPRYAALSPWFGPDDWIFSNPDSNGIAELQREGPFRLTKVTDGKTFAVYREEPGFMSSENNGFSFEVQFTAEAARVVDSRFYGMGFLVYDGQSVFQFNLFGGSVNTVGLLQQGGNLSSASSYYLPTSLVDWTGGVTLRVTVDPRRNKIEMFLPDSDLVTPILSRDFDRGDLPDGSEAGFVSAPAFVAFGHLNESNTAGNLDVYRLSYSTMYQAYEVWDGYFPDDLQTDPIWTRVSEGFNILSPLYGTHLFGGGFGTTLLGYYLASGTGPIGIQELIDNQLVLTNTPGALQLFKRSGAFDDDRGAILETRLQITDWKPNSRTGIFLIIDDGLRAYMLSFVDTPIGKFVGVTVRAGLSSFTERVGTEGEAETLSFRVDWSQPHVYRMEKRPLDGLYIFVDNNVEPELVLLDSSRVDFPQSQFLSPTVSFGQMTKEGSVSKWDFVRAMFSRGYEVSAKKVESDIVLEGDIGNSQAIVVAYAQD